MGSIDHFSGDVAECGVWKGQTLFGIAHLLRLRGIAVPILGFDSFEGLPEPTVEDSSNGKFERITQEGVFGDTSYDDVLRRSQQLGFKNIELVQGYFEDTLKQYEDRRFSFVHLDVDLYRSYSTCLHFFYSRMVPNGVIVFDEYEWTPTFPGASLAINEFFQNKPECIQYFADLGLDARHFIVKASSSNLSVSAEGRARSANF